MKTEGKREITDENLLEQKKKKNKKMSFQIERAQIIPGIKKGEKRQKVHFH